MFARINFLVLFSITVASKKNKDLQFFPFFIFNSFCFLKRNVLDGWRLLRKNQKLSMFELDGHSKKPSSMHLLNIFLIILISSDEKWSL